MIETWLSDFHKVLVTVMKTSYRKFESEIVNYRKYKDFSNNSFRKFLINELCKITISKSDEGMKGFWGLSRNFRQFC